MIDERLSSTARVARYGVPMVVGIFYLTASLGFDFTSEGTWAMAGFMKYGFSLPFASGAPSPLWEFILTVAGWFHLDPILAGKVLSLIFSCLTILLCYLIAHEILRDHIMALCVTLIMAMQGWLIQIAPSGSALSGAVALLLASVFFMLRNEYVVAPVMLGLCTLVFWQASILLVPLCADIWINSISKKRAIRVLLTAGLAYAGALLPWLAICAAGNREIVPVLLGMTELPSLTVMTVLPIAVSGICALVGLLLALPEEEQQGLRANLGPVTFMILLFLLGITVHADVWYAGIPLVFVYGFWGLREVLKGLGRENLTYGLSCAFTGLLLVGVQSGFYRENRPSMVAAATRAQELRAAAEWIRTSSPAGQSICAEHPFLVAYYVERPVVSLNENGGSHCDLVVSTRGEMPGYEMAFSPDAGLDTVPVQRYSVWRKN